jgi:hypothetical protein
MLKFKPHREVVKGWELNLTVVVEGGTFGR